MAKTWIHVDSFHNDLNFSLSFFDEPRNVNLVSNQVHPARPVAPFVHWNRAKRNKPFVSLSSGWPFACKSKRCFSLYKGRVIPTFLQHPLKHRPHCSQGAPNPQYFSRENHSAGRILLPTQHTPYIACYWNTGEEIYCLNGLNSGHLRETLLMHAACLQQGWNPLGERFSNNSRLFNAMLPPANIGLDHCWSSKEKLNLFCSSTPKKGNINCIFFFIAVFFMFYTFYWPD